VQLFPAEVAGEVVVGQNNQHLATAVHTVRHVLDERCRISSVSQEEESDSQ